MPNNTPITMNGAHNKSFDENVVTATINVAIMPKIPANEKILPIKNYPSKIIIADE